MYCLHEHPEPCSLGGAMWPGTATGSLWDPLAAAAAAIDTLLVTMTANGWSGGLHGGVILCVSY